MLLNQQIKRSGASYFIQGWRLIRIPGIKRFIFLPLITNIILIGGAFYWLFGQLNGWIPHILSYLPSWLQWLNYLIWPTVVLPILLIFGYFFSTLANFIAAPFNGLLAEQLEAHLTKKNIPDTSFIDIIRDLPRIMKRECIKLGYYLPRSLVILLCYFIPGVGQAVVPIIWFLFSAWMIAIQYSDYPFDNHKVSFITMRNSLKKDRLNNLQFGALVYLFTLIPIVNLIIMPVAVCGATAMWVDRYQQQLGRHR